MDEMSEADIIEFEVDFLVFVILTENPGMSYEDARRQAVREMKEDSI